MKDFSLSLDKSKKYLLGLSGGGHMALMMAAKHPKRFCAIGAFVPITDLNAWAEENPNYRPHVLACCSDNREEMAARSPISYIPEIASANLKIFHGKYDGVVPVSHSLRLYSKIMEYDPRSRVFLDIFDGGHQIDMAAAEYWITSQDKKITLDQVTG